MAFMAFGDDGVAFLVCFIGVASFIALAMLDPDAPSLHAKRLRPHNLIHGPTRFTCRTHAACVCLVCVCMHVCCVCVCVCVCLCVFMCEWMRECVSFTS